MRACLLCLWALGCIETSSTTTVKVEPIDDCPTDRPIGAADLDCVCGDATALTIIDTTLSATCDELWCHAEEHELECITFGTTTDETVTDETVTDGTVTDGTDTTYTTDYTGGSGTTYTTDYTGGSGG
jgi:hypothetical protein